MGGNGRKSQKRWFWQKFTKKGLFCWNIPKKMPNLTENSQKLSIFWPKVCLVVDLTIIASVEEGRPNSNKRLDEIEKDFENRLMTMSFHGGINVRDDSKRGNK